MAGIIAVSSRLHVCCLMMFMYVLLLYAELPHVCCLGVGWGGLGGWVGCQRAIARVDVSSATIPCASFSYVTYVVLGWVGGRVGCQRSIARVHFSSAIIYASRFSYITYMVVFFFVILYFFLVDCLDDTRLRLHVSWKMVWIIRG